MIQSRRKATLRRLRNLQCQAIQQSQEPGGINWRLILAVVGGIALGKASARTESLSTEHVTLERSPAPVTGLSQTTPIPWGRYAVAGLAGYFGGKLIEPSLSTPVMSQSPPSPSSLKALPRGPAQNPTRRPALGAGDLVDEL